MGCCSSKSDNVQPEEEEGYIPSRRINTIQNQQVPPIVITKAQSLASSVDSLPVSSSANNVQEEHEKPPVIIEEQIQENHQYGEPPAFEEQAEATAIKDIKPVIVTTSQSTLIPASTIATNNTPEDTTITITEKEASSQSEATLQEPAWPILVRLSNSSVKDVLIDIPTNAPFMTVSDLKQKIQVDEDQQIKLIHLGRILQDQFILVPSTCTIITSDVIKVSNRGVIQAMIYKQA